MPRRGWSGKGEVEAGASRRLSFFYNYCSRTFYGHVYTAGATGGVTERVGRGERGQHWESVWEFSSVAWHVTPTQVNGFYFGRLDAFERASLAHVARSLSVSRVSALSFSLATVYTKWLLVFIWATQTSLLRRHGGMGEWPKKEAELVAKRKKNEQRKTIYGHWQRYWSTMLNKQR